MRMKRKISLSLGILWAVFLGVVYFGTVEYLPDSMLKFWSGQDSGLSIERYAVTQLISHYLLVFLFVGLLFAVLARFLLRAVLFKRLESLESQLGTIYANADYSSRIKLTTEDELAVVAKQFNRMLDTIQVLHNELEQFAFTVDELGKELALTAKRADRADGIFHEIRDVLNSIGTGVYLIREQMRISKAEKLMDLTALLAEHKTDLSDFMTQNVKGQQVPEYLMMLAKAWVEENRYLTEQLAMLDKNLVEMEYVIKRFDKESV